MTRNFRDSLQLATVSFITYVLSLMAALAWTGAVNDYIMSHNNKWIRWVFALGISVFALVVIAVIVVFMDDDSDEKRKATAAQLRIRGMDKPMVGGI